MQLNTDEGLKRPLVHLILRSEDPLIMSLLRKFDGVHHRRGFLIAYLQVHSQLQGLIPVQFLVF